jgi:glycosidase
MLTFYTTKLSQIYGDEMAAQVAPRLSNVVESYRHRMPRPSEMNLTERDAFLISYADQVTQPGEHPLKTLREFSTSHLRGLFSGIHILPFFPWSSDDGFSITDYRAVNPSLGDWQDVELISNSFRLMMDGVINHTSVQSTWFKAFLDDELPYRDYFLTIQDNPDLSRVVRPRALPLLTEFQTSAGRRRVWTTFSTDQADLDYHNPDVLLEIFDILLTYVEHGAQFIRLDAVAYLWKEIGTTCIHLLQTHAIIQLLRAILDEIAPHVYLITETNVPHAENIAYFGDGSNEAQLIYNFALPPLVLHTFRTGNASILSQWASKLHLPSKRCSFFNFLASHDGVGLNPVREILSPADIQALVDLTQAHGGLISYKRNQNGTQSPYELNINYFDALSDPHSIETLDVQVDRFIAAHAIMVSLQGIPGIYFHSLVGSRNWRAGVEKTHQNRTINRQKLERSNLEKELAASSTLRWRVFSRLRDLLLRRASSRAFHPQGTQEILDTGAGVFGVLRKAPDGKQHMFCLQNITAFPQPVSLHNTTTMLSPYQTLWEDGSCL